VAKAKFSKSMLLRGLERFESAEAVAYWLGVHRTTVWRKMRAWNIDLQQVKAEFATRDEAARPAQVSAVPMVPTCPVILSNGQPCPMPMPHEHAVNGSMLPQQPRYNHLAMSYGPPNYRR